MQQLIHAEMIDGAVQLAVYFVTAIGAFLSFVLTARA